MTKNFPKGAFLLEYSGELITAEDGECREEKDDSVVRYFFPFKG